jgi:hypothetical protein
MPGSGPATNTLGRLAITAGFQRWEIGHNRLTLVVSRIQNV